MECNSRIDQQRVSLTSGLSSFPDLELAACGVYPNSLKHWFLIRHKPSQRPLSESSLDASDFSAPRFIELLESFSEECRSERCHPRSPFVGEGHPNAQTAVPGTPGV